MPVTLQPSGMKYKNGSTFQNADCLKGDKGDPGVYYGTTAPTDPDVTVWIDPSGSTTETISDVQVNGTSIVNNGVANVPVASMDNYGAVKVSSPNGTQIRNGILSTQLASDAQIKSGSQDFRPIVPSNQEKSVFYGLAKAAGDTTQSASSNGVGTYTESAKSAIRTMLGVGNTVSLVENVSGTTPFITGEPNVRYLCGEVSLIDITPPSSGAIDVIFTSGATPSVLTVPNTVKFPAWFDSTSLESNTIYEIMITDGAYGAVMSWEN